MASNDFADLTPKDFMQLSDALAVSLRLLLLDRVWTREAQRASKSSTRDPSRVAELSDVASEMESLLNEVQQSAVEVTAIAERTGTLLQDRFDALTSTPPRGLESERASTIAKRLRHHVNERADGSAVTYLSQASTLLRDRGSLEIKAIGDELRKVENNGSSAGDMSAETQEAVGAIALGAGLMFGPEAAGAVIVVAEIVDCLT